MEMLRLPASGVIVLGIVIFWITASTAHDRGRWSVGLAAVAAVCSAAVTGGILALTVSYLRPFSS